MMLMWHRLNADGTVYEAQGIIEDAYSVVWTQRWQDYGEAQVDLPPTHDVRTGDLITMPERDMAAEVVGRTETERGVQLRCRDALSVLDRRIVYPTVSNNGLVRTFVQKLLANGEIITAGGVPIAQADKRTLLPVRVGILSGITGSASIQRSYGQVGETLLELGRAYDFNPYCVLSSAGLLEVWTKGNSATRVWGIGRNLAGYTEDVDLSGVRTTAYVGVQEVSPGRRVVRETGGTAARSMDRRETFVDRRDIAVQGLDMAAASAMYGSVTQYAALTVGTVTRGEGPYEVVDLSFEGSVACGDTVLHFTIASVQDALGNTALVGGMIADASTTASTKSYTGTWNGSDGWTVTMETTTFTVPSTVLDSALFDLHPMSVQAVLSAIGQEELSDLQPETAFEATTEGLTPYVDYALGDTVAIYKADGGRKDMRVVEVVESWDSQGYRATPGLASL